MITINEYQKTTIAITILRLGLAFVFLWFGFSQLSDAAQWVGFVPGWATHFIPSGTLVLFNGMFEVSFGILLALGVVTRAVSLFLAIHLMVIALSIGFNAIGVRDIGLSLATVSLVFFGGGHYALTRNNFLS